MPNIVANENVHPKQLDFSSLIKSFYWKSENPDAPARIQRPLSYLSFALNWYAGEDNGFGYHVVNFIIHLTSTCFLYLFTKSTLVLPIVGKRYENTSHLIAFLSTLIWAMHPIQVTAVTYIVQRMASMAGMFTIICLYYYLKGRTSGSNGKMVGWFIVSGISAMLALGTKENSAALPITIFIYEVLLIQGVGAFSLKKWIQWGLPILLILLTIAICYVNPATILHGFANRPYTPVERVLTESRVILYYLRLLFYPLLSEFTLIHDFVVSKSLGSPWTTLVSISAISGLILSSIFWISRRQPIIAFSILFFLINHVIEGSFIALELIYEHRNYVPSMFVFLLPSMIVINILHYFSYNRKFQFFIVFSVAIILSSIGHSTYAYNKLFQNGLLLWGDNAKKSPGLSVVHNNYGIQLMLNGFTDEAFSTFQRSIQTDRYFNDSQRGLGYHNLGVYFETVTGDHKRALSCYKKAIERAFNSRTMWYSMSMSLLLNGETDKSYDAIQKALVRWPDDPDFLIAEAKIRILRREWDQALENSRRIRHLFPHAVEPLALLGEIYRQTGNFEKAIFFWKQYRNKSDHNWVADLALVDIYGKTKRVDKQQQVLCRLYAAMAGQNWSMLLNEGKDRAILFEINAVNRTLRWKSLTHNRVK